MMGTKKQPREARILDDVVNRTIVQDVRNSTFKQKQHGKFFMNKLISAFTSYVHF